MSDCLEALLAELRKLPGVGAKTANRLAGHLLRSGKEEAGQLARAIDAAVEALRPCSRCFDLASSDPCPLCLDAGRKDDLLCVVEDPWALRRIEATGSYRGRYHVLHGALSPIKGIGPDDLRVDALVRRVHDEAVAEVIVATSPTSDGEATASYIADRLQGDRVKVTRIAYGLPVGADLEAVDDVTIEKALKGRSVI